ncbi:MAG TPA: agmatinase family protein [Agriterribacter sp.]|nr:agmatinase family protein [Chitinophagaceae bacterium]HRP30883.1 agmatinase family protein [Agriterribacter sp.]
MDISKFDPNSSGNPNYNIFGLPFTEEDARLVVLPVPWEVTVSYLAGTARAPERIKKASLHVDLFDPDVPDGWKQGFHLREPDKKILFKSDYLRKEAELVIDFISQGQQVNDNRFMCKALKEVNEGSAFLNGWVYDQTKALLDNGKLVGLLGGDHSTPIGFYKAMAEKYNDFGILQIDAHCDLRKAYLQFTHSHASIMYNALHEIPQLTRLVQVGVRDFSQSEWEYITNSNNRVVTYLDKQIKERQFEGVSWQYLTDEIINHLPQNVFISFDIDGLNRTLCPHTGTPVPGGFEAEQLFYLFRRVLESGRRLIGFDLCEVGISSNEWDENVGARVLFKLCNLMVASN